MNWMPNSQISIKEALCNADIHVVSTTSNGIGVGDGPAGLVLADHFFILMRFIIIPNELVLGHMTKVLALLCLTSTIHARNTQKRNYIYMSMY